MEMKCWKCSLKNKPGPKVFEIVIKMALKWVSNRPSMVFMSNKNEKIMYAWKSKSFVSKIKKQKKGIDETAVLSLEITAKKASIEHHLKVGSSKSLEFLVRASRTNSIWEG